MRPVQAHAIAHRSAEQLVDRHLQRASLQVEQPVLDGADGLLHDAARRLATNRLHQRHVRLERARVFADQIWREALDDGVQAGPAEGLVELAPADQAVVGSDLQIVEVAAARVGLHGFNALDLHALLLPRWIDRARSGGRPLRRPADLAGGDDVDRCRPEAPRGARYRRDHRGWPMLAATR